MRPLTSMLLACVLSGIVHADLVFEPTWEPPTEVEVRAQVDQWLTDAGVDDQLRSQVDAIWSSSDTSASVLDRVATTIAEVDDRGAKLVEHCRHDAAPVSPPSVAWLNQASVVPFVRHNLRLYVARWQMHAQLYDEAAQILDGLTVDDVVDPAALLFYRMAAYHQIVQPDRSRVALVQLLEQEDQIPQRFARVARLVERDLASLDDESLDHISRRMNDIRRRLSVGRAGQKVQLVERGVVESLDQLIKQEQDRQQQQQSQSNSPSQSSRPMEDSRPAELKAPGRVDPKDIGSRSGWGDLPPKERAQALEQLGREFPAHYRELIEQYFRDLADESQPSDR